eukprot:GHVQ01038990.1.p1 GENE.GHVQ01038990.1~~GHVQ01038990.1.p1  ORF type:complete len:239 (-),score=46.35 GHVQ01038990.1:11-691(-)
MVPSARHTVRQRGSSHPPSVRLENRYSALLSVSATTSSASVAAPAAAALSQFPPLSATKARWADIELLSEDEDMRPVCSASYFSASTHKQKSQHKPQKSAVVAVFSTSSRASCSTGSCRSSSVSPTHSSRKITVSSNLSCRRKPPLLPTPQYPPFFHQPLFTVPPPPPLTTTSPSPTPPYAPPQGRQGRRYRKRTASVASGKSVSFSSALAEGTRGLQKWVLLLSY